MEEVDISVLDGMSYEEVRDFLKTEGIYYYGRPSDSFCEQEGEVEAMMLGLNKIIFDNMS